MKGLQGIGTNIFAYYNSGTDNLEPCVELILSLTEPQFKAKGQKQKPPLQTDVRFVIDQDGLKRLAFVCADTIKQLSEVFGTEKETKEVDNE